MAKQDKKTEKKQGGDIGDEFKVTPVSAFKKKSGRRGAELVLPSGLTCKAGRVDLQVFLKTGKVPNSLRGMIDRAMQGNTVSQDEIMDQVAGEDFAKKLVAGDPETVKKFDELMAMVDAVVVDCMIDPKVIPSPATEEERSETELHADEIEDQDKMFIFNFALGGVRDLEPFREGQRSNVEYLLAGQGSGV